MNKWLKLKDIFAGFWVCYVYSNDEIIVTTPVLLNHTLVNALPIPTYWMLTITLQGRYYDPSHYTKEIADSQYVDSKSGSLISELHSWHTCSSDPVGGESVSEAILSRGPWVCALTLIIKWPIHYV